MRSVPVRPKKKPLNIKNKDCTILDHIKYPDEKVLNIRLRDTKTAKHHELTVSPEFYNQITHFYDVLSKINYSKITDKNIYYDNAQFWYKKIISSEAKLK